MKVFLAGEFPLARMEGIGHLQTFWDICDYRLFSYYYHGNPKDEEVLEHHNNGIELFLDSGAFTAFTKKKTIDIDRYIDFAQEADYYYPVSNLDVIGDSGEKSFENMQYIADRMGKKRLMPVFHLRDDIEWLPRILDEGYEYIALGGLVGSTFTQMSEWLDLVWHKYLTHPDGTPKLKVHGFGLTTVRAITGYPWYSVDSSSWLMTSIYGSCYFVQPHGTVKVIFSEENPQKRNANSWHYNTLPPVQKQEVDAWLEPFGITAAQCAEYWAYRCIINAAGFASLDQFAPTKYKQKQRVLF